jgi:hypothetical protein
MVGGDRIDWIGLGRGRQEQGGNSRASYPSVKHDMISILQTRRLFPVVPGEIWLYVGLYVDQGALLEVVHDLILRNLKSKI